MTENHKTPDADDIRTRLLEAAGQVFAENGFRAGTVGEICKRARANIAAVNYHFGTKENLYVQAVVNAHTTCLSRVPMPDWPAGTPALVKLRDFIGTFLRRLIIDHGPEWQPRLIMRELIDPTEACAAMVEGQIRPTFGILKGILDELLPADTPPVKRRLIGFSIIGQILHYRLVRPVLLRLVGEEEFRSYDVELLTEHIYGFTVNALGLNKVPRPVEAKP